MSRAGKHRQKLISSAVKLFRRQGYAGTGVNEILSESGAPKGSLYHYFPGGKEQIGEASVATAGEVVTNTLNQLYLSTNNAKTFLQAYGDALTNLLRGSSFRDGCPIATVLLETAPQSGSIAATGEAAFSAWRSVLIDVLVRDDFPRVRAAQLSGLILSAYEGALVLSRTQQSTEPVETVTSTLTDFIELERPFQTSKTATI